MTFITLMILQLVTMLLTKETENTHFEEKIQENHSLQTVRSIR